MNLICDGRRVGIEAIETDKSEFLKGRNARSYGSDEIETELSDEIYSALSEYRKAVKRVDTMAGKRFLELKLKAFDDFYLMWQRVKDCTATLSENVNVTGLYPDPPKAVIEASDIATLPPRPGIYFVWRQRKIRYVGQSIRLSRRCRLLGHDKIWQGDWLSWVELPIVELFFAENFYIGALRPERNLPVRHKEMNDDARQ